MGERSADKIANFRNRYPMLKCFLTHGVTVPGTLVDKVVSMGESLIRRAYFKFSVIKTMQYNDGYVNSIRHLLHSDNIIKPYSHEHLLVHLLTTSLGFIMYTIIYVTLLHNYIIWYHTHVFCVVHMHNYILLSNLIC